MERRILLILALVWLQVSYCSGQTDSSFAAKRAGNKLPERVRETSAYLSGLHTGYVDAAANGIKCDGITDDSEAIQKLLTVYAVGGSLVGTIPQIVFPTGVCKISRELVYEGGASAAVRITGQAGWSTNAPGTEFAWYGPNFGTMMLIVGCNSCSIEN